VIGPDQEIERKRTWEKQLAWESEEERATDKKLTSLAESKINLRAAS